MARLRRTRYLAFTCQDESLPDFPALLRGEAKLAPFRRTYAISILRGKAFPITSDELDLLLSVPSDGWVDSCRMDGQMVQRLAHLGLVVTDDEDEELAELASRDRELEAGQWNLYGALAYFPTKWRDVDLGAQIGDADVDELPAAIYDAIDEFVAKHGSAPTAFHSLEDPRAVYELPLVERRGGLYEVLAQRKTTRRFDRDAQMTIEELATVLYYVFGCHGYARMAGNGLMMKRTSPSGGGLHPIEVYPLVAGVDGIVTGLYHYNTRDHTLELVAEAGAEEAAVMAAEFVCGQRYFSSANVLFLMTARFYRSFWKYRRHQKAYAALMMDAAHLSQTLYLVAAELGLGAFVTAAINGANIEERLGIDGWSEGAVAVSGCGRPSAQRSPLEPEFAPYVPRETELPGAPEGGSSPGRDS
jgi:putative peptide maturation dehydrogenase